MKKRIIDGPEPFIIRRHIRVLLEDYRSHVAGSFAHCMGTNAIRRTSKLPKSAIIKMDAWGKICTVNYQGWQQRYEVTRGSRQMQWSDSVDNREHHFTPFYLDLYFIRQTKIKEVNPTKKERARLKAQLRYRELKAAGAISNDKPVPHRAFDRKRA